MKYLLPLSCFRLRPDFHKDQTLFWSQSSLSLSWQSNLFLVLSIQKTGLRGITETKRQIFDIYSTIHCMHLFLKNQWSNSIFYFETKEFLQRFQFVLFSNYDIEERRTYSRLVPPKHVSERDGIRFLEIQNNQVSNFISNFQQNLSRPPS